MPDFCWCLPVLKGCSLAEVRASRLGLTSMLIPTLGDSTGLPPSRQVPVQVSLPHRGPPRLPYLKCQHEAVCGPCPELSVLSLLPVPVLVMMSYMFCLVVFRGEEAEECHVHSNHRAVPDGTGADPGGLPQHPSLPE